MTQSQELQKQRGFTLVELMVALLLFSFAIAGILSVAVTMTRSFREQRRVIATEQAVRAPLDFVVDALRQASPGVTTGTIRDATTCAIGAISLTNNDAAPDELELVYAAGGVVSTTHSAITSTSYASFKLPAIHAVQFAQNDYVLITNADQGTIFRVSTPPTTSGDVGTIQLATAASCSGTPDLFPAAGYPERSIAIRVARARFKIQPLDGIPTLMMDPDGNDGTAAEVQPVAQGVEDMQIAVGVDTDDDTVINDWIGDVGLEVLSTTAKIRAVRVVMIARDRDPLQGPASFYPVTALNRDRSSEAADKYRRRVLTSTVEIRNLLGSP